MARGANILLIGRRILSHRKIKFRQCGDHHGRRREAIGYGSYQENGKRKPHKVADDRIESGKRQRNRRQQNRRRRVA